MSEMTPTPFARRRRTVLLALAISAILSPSLARSIDDDQHSDRQSDTDFFAENANNPDYGEPDDVSPFLETPRLASDQCASFLRWGGSRAWDRRWQCRADHSLHAWMAHRARSLVLSSEAMAVIGVWRGPRGPPPKIRGRKKFLGYVFSLHRSAASTFCQLSSVARRRQQNFGRSDGEFPTCTQMDVSRPARRHPFRTGRQRVAARRLCGLSRCELRDTAQSTRPCTGF